MGLFSSKKKIIVGTSASRLIEDALLPNSIRSGMARGLLQTSDIPGSIMDEMAQGIANRADKMYRYSENGYTFGSPSGEYLSTSQGTSELLAVLTALEGTGVEIEYSHIGPPNILHIGWLKLIRDHGYNPVTNKLAALSVTKGTDVFVHDIQVEIPLGSTASYSGIPLQQWGVGIDSGARSFVSPTRPAITEDNGLGAMLGVAPVIEVAIPAGDDCARVTYAWVSPTTDLVVTDSLRITNAEYDEAGTFMQARYRVGGVTKYWIYKLGTTTYPTLDALVNAPVVEGGNYFPFVHFRSKKASIGANTSSTAYLHSVKMGKKLGFDYDTLLDAIHDNPDIGSLEQAFLGLMVPANSVDPVEQKYLFDFFNRMYEAGRVADPAWAAQLNTVGRYGDMQLPNLFSEVIQDTHVKLVIVNSGIQKFSVASGGVVGTNTSGYTVAPGGSSYEGYHWYRRQISPNIVHELRVLDLYTRYWVAEDYYAASDGDGENTTLLIPIDRSISADYGPSERETLYSRSLHIIVNSLVVQTVKWYQRSGWANLMKIAAIVIFVWTLGTGGYVSALLAAGADLVAVALILIEVLINVIVNVVIAYAFQFVASALGTDLALLVAVIAAAYGAYEAFNAGGLSMSFTAQMALDVATNLVKGISANVMDAMKAIYLEMSSFQSEAEDRLKLLEETKDLLDMTERMNPMLIFGETPENYYNRTVHSGNVGTIGFAAIHSFVDVALTLPKISDTVEGF